MKKRFGSGSGKTYADVLTILLVIIIIAIVALLGYFAYKVIDKNKVEANASSANDEFLKVAEENKKKIKKASTNETDVNTSSEVDYDKLHGIVDSNNQGETSNTTTEQSNSQKQVKKTYLGNYEIKGSIDIPKTGCKYPILAKVSVDSLKKAPAILEIRTSSELNETVRDLNVPGTNAFILGHNYRNGQFFSDNDKLSIGDTIKITDQTGETVSYKIYNMFYTDPNDASFMERDIDINTREITLQTCNEDSSERLIICAKDN